MVAVVAEVQLVDAIAVLVVVQDHVEMPLTLASGSPMDLETYPHEPMGLLLRRTVASWLAWRRTGRRLERRTEHIVLLYAGGRKGAKGWEDRRILVG
jgi:hypothetical protein